MSVVFPRTREAVMGTIPSRYRFLVPLALQMNSFLSQLSWWGETFSRSSLNIQQCFSVCRGLATAGT